MGLFLAELTKGIGYNSRRLAADLCGCLMILNSAEGCFAEIATDPEKLLRIQSGLSDSPSCTTSVLQPQLLSIVFPGFCRCNLLSSGPWGIASLTLTEGKIALLIYCIPGCEIFSCKLY